MTPARLAWLDAARGAALIPMALYHGAWDLSLFGWIATDIAHHAGWTALARATTVSFLVISGIGLALAARAGAGPGRALRRVGRIAAAAGLVSLATWWFAPANMVLFGILHAIALGSLLAWPLRRAPDALLLALAALVMALPFLLRDPAFAGPGWSWLGLSPEPSAAFDHVPLAPWWGWMLLGLVAGRRLPLAGAGAAPGAVVRGLAWAGRRSLPIYLLHQPLFIGALMLAAHLAAPSPAALRESWREALRADCAASGDPAPVCAAYAECAVSRLAPEPGLLDAARRKRLTQAQRARFESVLDACEAEAGQLGR
ncbi:heparan-alpha-glucosaminide N-acetyltransferase [Rubritepida flocculans]|uniref:heparan-alpha-glucosaminide N-acetyltransferase n=1 Tax=Rubritepida flocculans TaxID=182403 RepID=UPI000412CC51|nr:heparan-alpha-glucosaminide N-acetyltransferase [Rubritepida flocculans]